MSIRNNGRSANKGQRMKYPDTLSLQDSVKRMRQHIANEQAAMHQVQLTVARWRGALADGRSEAQHTPAMAASQGAWHAAAQCHFLCWLADGGFSQALDDPGIAVPATAARLPADTQPSADTAAQTAVQAASCHNCTT